MTEDPRRAIVEVMARLGKETQLHVDERERHFEITDIVIIAVSVLLVILAIFNIYYVRVLYHDLNGIVSNMDSMYINMQNVEQDMVNISANIGLFDDHVKNMTPIHKNITQITEKMPKIRSNMHDIREDMGGMGHEMGLLGNAMGSISQRTLQMKAGMSVMRHNVRSISRPMGIMNPILP